MQTSKLILVICAVALFTGDSILRAQETEAQKRAREALRQKMLELEGQPIPVAPPPPAVPQPPEAAPPQAIAPATPAPVAPDFAPAPSVNRDAQARALEALRQKMHEGQPQQPAAPATVATPAAPPQPITPVTPPAPAPVAAPVARSADRDAQARALEALRQSMNAGQVQQPGTPPPARAATWSPGATDTSAQARAQQALELKMRELDAGQPVAPPVAPPVTSPAAPTFPEVAFKPIEPLPSPVSGPKAQRLSELLRKYRADQITPEDYHKQRAAILAEQ
jgi:hypothetical protein